MRREQHEQVQRKLYDPSLPSLQVSGTEEVNGEHCRRKHGQAAQCTAATDAPLPRGRVGEILEPDLLMALLWTTQRANLCGDSHQFLVRQLRDGD